MLPPPTPVYIKGPFNIEKYAHIFFLFSYISLLINILAVLVNVMIK
jgi:hypothetical protein